MRYLYHVVENKKTQEDQMKQWLAALILPTDELMMEEPMPMNNVEFVISISLIVGALAIFAFFIHVLGA